MERGAGDALSADQDDSTPGARPARRRASAHRRAAVRAARPRRRPRSTPTPGWPAATTIASGARAPASAMQTEAGRLQQARQQRPAARRGRAAAGAGRSGSRAASGSAEQRCRAGRPPPTAPSRPNSGAMPRMAGMSTPKPTAAPARPRQREPAFDSPVPPASRLPLAGRAWRDHHRAGDHQRRAEPAAPAVQRFSRNRPATAPTRAPPSHDMIGTASDRERPCSKRVEMHRYPSSAGHARDRDPAAVARRQRRPAASKRQPRRATPGRSPRPAPSRRPGSAPTIRPLPAARRRWPAPSRRWRRARATSRRALVAGSIAARRARSVGLWLGSRAPPGHRQSALGAAASTSRAGRGCAARSPTGSASSTASSPPRRATPAPSRGARRRPGGALIVALGGDGTISEVADGILDAGAGARTPSSASSRAAPAATSGGRSTCRTTSPRRPGACATGRRAPLDAGRVTFVATTARTAVAPLRQRRVVRVLEHRRHPGQRLVEAAGRADGVLRGDGARAACPTTTPTSGSPSTTAAARAAPGAVGRRRQRALLRRRHEDLPAGAARHGALDLVIVGDFTRRRGVTQIGRLYSGDHLTLEEVSTATARTLEAAPVEATRTCPIELDGETPGRLPARSSRSCRRRCASGSEHRRSASASCTRRGQRASASCGRGRGDIRGSAGPASRRRGGLQICRSRRGTS